MQLQFITHHTDRYTYADSARMALEGGCRWIQLRIKDATDDEVRPVARQVQQWCRDCGATFVLDDRVRLALELKADGVHLGRTDMPVEQARQVLGGQTIIGGTANTIDDVVRLAHAGADYIGCGPFRFTTTKQNLSPVLGLEGYERILSSIRAAGIRLPIIGIGGITPADIAPLRSIGLDGIALSGTVMRADDPVQAMRNIMQSISQDKQI